MTTHVTDDLPRLLTAMTGPLTEVTPQRLDAAG